MNNRKYPRGYAAIGLYAPKTDANVGGAMRAAFCYGASLVVIQGARYKRQSADITKAWRHIPVLHVEDLVKSIPFDCQPICVELTDAATPMESFSHPERAFYIFGPEDGSIPVELTNKYRTIKISSDFCMNLAATVNVVLYDRRAKETRL
jgi:tRNA(Leu) C34 or U34 (ribose-2'-O)-methylase TrmL